MTPRLRTSLDFVSRHGYGENPAPIEYEPTSKTTPSVPGSPSPDFSRGVGYKAVSCGIIDLI